MADNYIGRSPAPNLGSDPTVALLAMLCGSIVYRHNVTPGLVRANGQSLVKATYPDLWTYAQGFLTVDQVANPGLYKDVDAVNFAVPKLDGMFLRSQGTFDANRLSLALGVRQDDVLGSHVHTMVGNVMSNPGGLSIQGATGSAQYITQTNANTGAGTETRVVNVALIPCIFTGKLS